MCFFDRTGSIVLCNRQMYQLSRFLLDSDMQYLGEVQEALSAPGGGIVRIPDIDNTYRFPDKTVWRFEKTEVTDRYGTRQLSDNAGALAREKELLDAKSAMHDGLAACITLTKQYITGEFDGMDPGVVCHEWEKVIAFRDTICLPARKRLLDSAKASGVTVRIRGQEPTDGEAELLYTAMQVCLNNAIQYAKATEISANIWENQDSYTVVIRNNGKPPEKGITEGGGLTNLRHRIENSGGKMTVQSLPRFSLAIEIPKSGNSGVNNL